MADGVASVDSLPWEMLLKVLSYLDTHDLVETVPHVCQRWREASMEAQLWINRPFCPDEYYSHKEILHCLKKMPELRHANLSHCLHLGYISINDILEALCKYCPKLESFAVERSFYYSMEKMRTFIINSAKLSSLSLRGFHCRDYYGLLAATRGSRKIKHLSLELFMELRADSDNEDDCGRYPSKEVQSLKQLVKSDRTPKSLHFFCCLESLGILPDVLQTTSHVLTGMHLVIIALTDANIVNVFKELLNSFHSIHNIQLEVDGKRNRAYILKFLHVVRHVLTELDIKHYEVEKDKEYVEWGNVLSECHQLQSLKLKMSKALPNLGQLPSVTTLYLCSINTYSDVIINLFLHGSWQQLKTLHMVYINWLDSDAWHQIFTCCPNLQHINLTQSNLSLDCISNLVRYCPSVRELILSKTNVRFSMLRYLYKLRGLELVCLKECFQLTTFDVGDIIKCGNVKILNLNYCSWLEHSTLTNILAIGNLEVLSILHIGAPWTYFSSVKTVSKRLRKICVCICEYNEGEPVCKALEHVRLTTLPCHREEGRHMSDDCSESCDYEDWLHDSDDEDDDF